jgi:hypothetical protein
MASMYGHKWTSSYGAEIDPDRVWFASIYDLDDEKIKKGLRACLDNGLEWPPSAPEFRKLCLGIRGDDYCAPAGIHKAFPKMLEDKTKIENARKVGADVLANLKAML